MTSAQGTLAAGLLAAHRLAARALGSTHRPQLADFEQLAAAAEDALHPAWVAAINHALEPFVKLDVLWTKLEGLREQFRRRKAPV